MSLIFLMFGQKCPFRDGQNLPGTYAGFFSKKTLCPPYIFRKKSLRPLTMVPAINVHGCLLRPMNRIDRVIVFNSPIEVVDRVIRCSDSSPKAVGYFSSHAINHQLVLFNPKIG